MISAFQLAEEATRINITRNDYCMDTQTRFRDEDCAGALTMTWNGTQTYDFQGKPNDADNDK